MKKIMIIILAVGLMMSLLVSCQTKNEFNEETWDKPYSLTFAKYISDNYPDCPKTTDRGYLPRQMFCKLPEIPSDFYRISALFEQGKLTDINDIKPEYWMQPEFLYNWKDKVLPALQYPSGTYIDRYNVAVYPSTLIYEIESTEGLANISEEWYEFEGKTTVRTSGEMIFFEGIKFVSDFPKGKSIIKFNEFSDGTKEVDNPSNINDFVQVVFTPQTITLTPAFPRFESGYVQTINFRVRIKQDAPPGRYYFNIGFDNPSTIYNHDETLKYLNLYRTAGQDVLVDQPQAQVYLWLIS